MTGTVPPRVASQERGFSSRVRDASSLLRNSGFLIASTLSTSGLGYLYWILAAHELQPQAIGLGAGLISAFGLISFLAGLGVDAVCIRVLPQLKDDPRQWNAFFAACLVVPGVLTAVTALATVLVLPRAEPSFRALEDPFTASLFVVGAVAMVSSTTLDGCFVALRRSGRHFARNTAFAVTKVPILLAIVLSFDVRSADALLLSWDLGLVLALLLGLLFLLPGARPGLSLLVRPDIRGFLGLWRTFIGLQLTATGAMLPGYIFPPLVVALLGERANATFYFTWSLSGIFFTISASIARALFAEAANERELVAEVRSAVKLTVFLMGPVIVVVVLLAHPLLSLFGDEYARNGTDLLRICALAAIPDSITNCYVAVMIVQGRLKSAAILNCAMAAIAVVGAAATLSRYGIEAAGWAWFAAQTLGAVFALAELARWRRRQHLGVVPLEGTDHR